jgi:nucleotide-binding universal stress UspA family protein
MRDRENGGANISLIVSIKETMLCGPRALSIGVPATIIPLRVNDRGGHPMPMKILFPFDGSRASLHAARHVARNLEGLDATVLLVNVQRLLVDAEMLHAARSIANLHRHEAEQLLRDAMAIFDAHGIRYEAEVAFGPPVPVIVRMAEERGCDLVVMGTRARHPLLEFFTRSVTSRVRRNSRVPVMLVRDEDRRTPSGPPLRAPYIAA